MLLTLVHNISSWASALCFLGKHCFPVSSVQNSSVSNLATLFLFKQKILNFFVHFNWTFYFTIFYSFWPQAFFLIFKHAQWFYVSFHDFSWQNPKMMLCYVKYFWIGLSWSGICNVDSRICWLNLWSLFSRIQLHVIAITCVTWAIHDIFL